MFCLPAAQDGTVSPAKLTVRSVLLVRCVPSQTHSPLTARQELTPQGELPPALTAQLVQSARTLGKFTFCLEKKITELELI